MYNLFFLDSLEVKSASPSAPFEIDLELDNIVASSYDQKWFGKVLPCVRLTQLI